MDFFLFLFSPFSLSDIIVLLKTYLYLIRDDHCEAMERQNKDAIYDVLLTV